MQPNLALLPKLTVVKAFLVFCMVAELIAVPEFATAKDTKPSQVEKQPASSDVDAEHQAEAAKSANNSRVEMTFGGSLCPVCLVAFQRRLMETPGVVAARVESLNIERAVKYGHQPKRAHAIVEFQSEKITQTELENIIRHNDFQFIKAEELPATN